MISLENRVVRSHEPVWSPVGDEVVMMSVEKGKYYSMNDIGAAIWTGIEEPTRVVDLCDSLEQCFDVSREQCVAEVLRFLEQLLAKGLVTVTA